MLAEVGWVVGVAVAAAVPRRVRGIGKVSGGCSAASNSEK